MSNSKRHGVRGPGQKPAWCGLQHLLGKARIFSWLFIFASPVAYAQTNQAVAQLVEMEGTVEILSPGANGWNAARANLPLEPGTRVRTQPRSRAVVRLTDQSLLRLGEETIIEVPPAAGNRVLKFLKGVFYYFHRDKPGVIPVKTPSAYAVVIGTEFEASVDAAGATSILLVDGRVQLSNDTGQQMELQSGESARVEAGKAPVHVPAIQMASVVQWALYYPGILNLNDLALSDSEQQLLQVSLSAWRSGDLLAALSSYPAGREPASAAEKIYYASLLLAVGKVEESSRWLTSLNAKESPDNRSRELAEALQTVVAAIQGRPRPSELIAHLSTSHLANSIHLQSRSGLRQSLVSARRAVEKDPSFGFGWARVAELEFSFGRHAETLQAIDRSLSLAPRNAEAFSLRGFVHASQDKWDKALADFNQAIALDGALGNAWLGRGLCKIRVGQHAEGRQDLQTAATLEPQRAIFRSYLGKAFAATGDDERAANELRLAKELDPADPTAWLYSGLVRLQENRINEAVRDLEKSVERNDNRGVYRSRLMLDQDRAVRSANLAVAYDDAGMSEWALQEAARSVAYDPANYSAHLFLANGFQDMRDPNGIQQRFETPAVNEYLLAGLLAPPSGSILAQSISQQEYSRLFERDAPGLSSTTEYFSNGDWLQAGAVYGSVPNLAYAFSGFYRSQTGWRPNNDLRQTELSLQLKHQLTAQDSFYFRAIWGDLESGDLLQRFDPATADVGLRVKERQEPLLLAGYHREWQPGLHTLVLGGWFKDDQQVQDSQSQALVQVRDAAAAIQGAIPIGIDQHYRNRADLFTLEAQQLWQTENHTLIAGGRGQGGSFDAENLHTNPDFIFPFLFPTTNVEAQSSMERYSVYGYHHWRPVLPLLFVAGLSYDWLRYPENFRFAPLTRGEDSVQQISPKGGIVWTPREETAIRAGYTRSLGGVSFEQSFRLEPTQVAGFNQAFRSLIPESIAGANSAAEFETWGVAWQERLLANTWMIISGEWLNSRLQRKRGVYDVSDDTVITPGLTTEKLDYEERSVHITFNQLVARDWAFGAQYRLSDAQLHSVFMDVPATAEQAGGFRRASAPESLLHRVHLFANYNHSSGFFGQGQALWFGQGNHGYDPALAGADFWQFNAFVGYRLWHRRAEVTVGVLNLTDKDYKLSPLNLVPELPRERTFLLALKLNL